MSDNIPVAENENTEKAVPRQIGGYLREAWLILLLAVLYGGLLAWIQLTLGPVIAENKKRETYSQIPELVTGADAAKTVELTVKGTDGKLKTVYQAFSTAGKHLGWVFPASGRGFADTIEILIGLDVGAETITGVFVLDQKETPGLGNFIKDDPKFAEMFHGLSGAKKLETVTSGIPAGNQIKAITGATISSQAVCDIVNDAVTKYRDAALAAAN